jgi:hypothetical protein
MKLFKWKKEPSQPNLDMRTIVPVHNVEYEVEESGNVTILKPKFTSKFSQKYITPRMKYPYYMIHLDEIGTTVWNCINGERTAVEIGDKLHEDLGEKIEPVFERLGMFLAKMKNENFIKW